MHDLESILAVDWSFDKTRPQPVEALSHLNVHPQDVNVMGKPVEQGAGQPLRAKDLGPFLLRSVRITPDTLLDAIQPQDGKLQDQSNVCVEKTNGRGGKSRPCPTSMWSPAAGPQRSLVLFPMR
jgi:hypothetical protein